MRSRARPDTYRVWFRCDCRASQSVDVVAEDAEAAIKAARRKLSTPPLRDNMRDNRWGRVLHRPAEQHKWRLDTWYLVSSEASVL